MAFIKLLLVRRRERTIAILVVAIILLTYFLYFDNPSIYKPSKLEISHNEVKATSAAIIPAITQHHQPLPTVLFEPATFKSKKIFVAQPPPKRIITSTFTSIKNHSHSILKKKRKKQHHFRHLEIPPEKRLKATTKSTIKSHTSKSRPSSSSASIILATSVCSKYFLRAAILLKSILVSIQLYHIPKLDLHLFLEHHDDRKEFFSKLKEFGVTNHTSPRFHVYFHYFRDIHPNKYQKQLMSEKKTRCQYAPIFIPEALKNQDSILYLEPDTALIGDPTQIISHLHKMNSIQLVGVTRDTESDNEFWKTTYIPNFLADIPHPQPTGLNPGILLMNLTRMREFNWEEKLLQAYQDYGKILRRKNTSQINWLKLINILLFYTENWLYVLPCHFNLRASHCSQGWFCPDVNQDSKGVQVIHSQMEEIDPGGMFHEIWNTYHSLNLTNDKLNLLHGLIKPIRKVYLKPKYKKERQSKSKCYGNLGKYLFSAFFPTKKPQIKS